MAFGSAGDDRNNCEVLTQDKYALLWVVNKATL